MIENQKTAVLTGASAGIGKAAAKALVALGWHVIGTGRDAVRSAQAENEITQAAQLDGRFSMVRGDMAFLASTAKMAAEIATLIPRIDVLICNAGGVRDTLSMSSEGHEATFAANHLSHFLLTQKLMPLLISARSARVISTSSDAHEYAPAMHWDDLNYVENFSTGATYCQAKLANVLFGRELAKRGAAHGITSNIIHPGPVTSNFWSHGDEVFQTRIDSIIDQAVTPEQAAQTIVWLATSDEAAKITGQYYFKGEPRDPSPAAMDAGEAEKLWAVSEGIVEGY